MSRPYTQTLKSATAARVDDGLTNNQAIARLNGHFEALCPTSAPDLQNDIFGRPVPQITLDMRGGGSECNFNLPPGQSYKDHIVRENLERPYAYIGPEGTRGAGDSMGVARDLVPQDLYGSGIRGNFVRHGQPGLTLAPFRYSEKAPVMQRHEQNIYYPPSHDVTNNYIYRG